jgi:hypothetical protein
MDRGMVGLPSLSENTVRSTHVPGILPKARSTPLIFCPLLSANATTAMKNIFFVSIAISKSAEKMNHGREASPTAYKFGTRSDLLLVSYLNISPIYYRK